MKNNRVSSMPLLLPPICAHSRTPCQIHQKYCPPQSQQASPLPFKYCQNHLSNQRPLYGKAAPLELSVPPASASPASISGLGWASYDLCVYSDISKNGPSVLIDLYTSGLTSYTHTEPVTGAYGTPTFSYIDSQNSPAGNYLVFTGLTATSFNAPPLSPISEAAINEFQLVGNTIPEPSPGSSASPH